VRRDPSFGLILLCFFLSGFAGLLFETLWTREFALVFGTSDLAVATVLAAYMGGLALGAAVARRLVLRARRPVLVYGFLELGIGLGALAVPWGIHASRSLCVLLFGGQPAPPDGTGIGLTLFTLASAFAILLVPTAFMGATLPLLTRFAVRRDDEIGSRVGLLYAVNTAGAVAGVLGAAFWLLPNLGLRPVLWIGVGVNVVVFLLASLAARGMELAPAPDAVETKHPAPPTRVPWILPLILLSGLASFSYEVLWTRLLGHVLGGTVYAFGTMLASFLAGIALGSAAASRRTRTGEEALLVFPLTQLGVAACALLAFALVDHLPELAIAWGAGGGGLLRNAGVAALVLLPGALFIGASFPLAVRILARSDLDASPASARVYAWNTLGAIIGSIGAGFVWIPLLGYHDALTATVGVNLAVAAAAAWFAIPRRAWLVAASLACAASLVFLRPGPPWLLLSTSSLDLLSGKLDPTAPDRVVYFAAGRSSTVMLRLGETTNFELLTNGLPEGSIRQPGILLMDSATQWLAALAVMARPEAQSALVIGLGAGNTTESVPDSVERVDVIEIEHEVVEANRRVADQRAADPLADPRVRVVVNDARGALQLTERRWDAIVSQPSHPWTAGASHLFTKDFFLQAREHLEPGGVLVQWMGAGFMDGQLLRSTLATLHSAFQHVRVYLLPHDHAVFFVASEEPLDIEAHTARALERHPQAFAHLGVHGPEDVAVRLTLDEAGTRALAEGAAISTDARNLFQFRAPRILRTPLGVPGVQAMTAGLDPLQRPDPEWDVERLARRLIEDGQVERARTLLAAISDPAERATIEGLLALREQRRPDAVVKLRRAVALDPSSREAWAALTRRPAPSGEAIYSPSARRVESYPGLETVAIGWDRVRARDWSGLAELDADLARIPAGDPLRADALRLRSRWRIEDGSEKRAEQAVAITDELLPLTHSVHDGIQRTRALQRAGYTQAALAELGFMVKGLGDSRDGRQVLDSIADALDEIPSGGLHGDRRDQVAAALLERRMAPTGSATGGPLGP